MGKHIFCIVFGAFYCILGFLYLIGKSYDQMTTSFACSVILFAIGMPRRD